MVVGRIHSVRFESPWYSPTGSSRVSYTRLSFPAGLFLLSPRLLLFMAGEARTLLTPLEAFLAFQFGTLLCAVSIGVIVNVRKPSAIPCVSTDKCKDPFRQFVHSSCDRPKTTPALSSVSRPYHWRITPDVPFSVQRQRNRDAVYCILRSHWDGRIVGVMDSETAHLIHHTWPRLTGGGIRSSSPALVGAQNLGQINAPPPSYLATNLQRRRSRKAQEINSPSCALCNHGHSHCQAGSRIMYVMFSIK